MKAYELLYKKKVASLFEDDTMPLKKQKKLAFAATQWGDAHIQQFLMKAAKKLNKSPQEIIAEFQPTLDKLEKYRQAAPMLYGTIAQNAIESEMFRFVEKHNLHDEGAPKFDSDTFFHLVSIIKAEKSGFFPLKDIIRQVGVKPVFILVPNEQKPMYNSVDTAAATEDGVFIFNTNFMQNLLEFAYIKGIKPKGKKYESNGGPIPDEYEYIEFIIIHEFMHFTQADWTLPKQYGYDITKNRHAGNIINWAGDFRNNYTIMKMGLQQLPMGLFSSEINYDKQATFKQMIDIVVSEFNNLPEEEKDELSDIINQTMDDHSKQSGESGESGESGGGGKPQKKMPKEGDIVKNKKTGEYGRVEKIGNDKVKITPISEEEAMKEKNSKK